MTATYTFDVFSSLDGFGAAGGDWTGYWGSRAPSCSTTASRSTAGAGLVLGANTYRAFAQMLSTATDDSEVRDPWVSAMIAIPLTVVSTTLREPLTGPMRRLSAAMPSTSWPGSRRSPTCPCARTAAWR